MIALAVLVCVVLAIGGGLVFFTALTVRKVEAALPPGGRFVDVPGARLHVVERGTGPPLLPLTGQNARGAPYAQARLQSNGLTAALFIEKRHCILEPAGHLRNLAGT